MKIHAYLLHLSLQVTLVDHIVVQPELDTSKPCMPSHACDPYLLVILRSLNDTRLSWSALAEDVPCRIFNERAVLNQTDGIHVPRSPARQTVQFHIRTPFSLSSLPNVDASLSSSPSAVLGANNPLLIDATREIVSSGFPPLERETKAMLRNAWCLKAE